MSGPVISTVEVMNEKEIVMKMLENCAGSAQDGVEKQYQYRHQQSLYKHRVYCGIAKRSRL